MAAVGHAMADGEERAALLPLSAHMDRDALVTEVEQSRTQISQLKAQVKRLRAQAGQLATKAEYDEELLAQKLMQRMRAADGKRHAGAAFRPSKPRHGMTGVGVAAGAGTAAGGPRVGTGAGSGAGAGARASSATSPGGDSGDASRARRLEHQLKQLRREKVAVEHKLEQEQEFMVNKLQRQIRELQTSQAELTQRLQREEQRADVTPTTARQLQAKLRRVQQEKVQLENQLEAEQECIVIKLQKRLKQAMEQQTKLQRRLSVDGSDLRGDVFEALTELKAALPLQKAAIVDRVRTNVETLCLKLAETRAELARTQRTADEQQGEVHDLQQRNFVLQQRVSMEHEKAIARQSEASRMAASLEADSERHFNQLSRGDSSGEEYGRARAASVESFSSARMLRSASGTGLAAAAATTPHSVSTMATRSPSPSPAFPAGLSLQADAERARRASFQALFDQDHEMDEAIDAALRSPGGGGGARARGPPSTTVIPSPRSPVVRGAVDASGWRP